MRVHTPPPSAWRVLLPVSAGTALSLAGDTTLYTVLSTHTAEAGIAFASVGLLLSLNRWVRLPLNRPAGGWIEKRPRKPIFVAALVLGAFSTFLYAQNLGLGVFLVARALWGIAWVGIWLTGNTLVLDVSDPTNRGRLLGLYQIAFFSGAGGGAFIGGLLTDWLGYHPAMFANTLLSLLGALIAWAFLPETLSRVPAAMSRRGRSAGGQQDPAAPPHLLHSSRPGTVKRSAQLATALALLAVNRLAMEGFLIATIALFFRQQLGEMVTLNGISIGTATLTGLGLGTTTLVSALAAPISGSASDRAASRWRTAAVWLLPGILGFWLLPIGTPLAIAAGLVGISAASGSSANLATALIGDLGRREQQGRRLGTLFTAGDLASAAGPPLAFWLLPLVGLQGIYWSAAGFFGLIFLFSSFWAFVLRRRRTPAAA